MYVPRESTWNDLGADGRVLGKLGWKEEGIMKEF
jgi:hypothetical protein